MCVISCLRRAIGITVFALDISNERVKSRKWCEMKNIGVIFMDVQNRGYCTAKRFIVYLQVFMLYKVTGSPSAC